MLFRREAYLAIGGHHSVSDSMAEDMSLVRRIKSARLRWRVAHVADLVSCRMYHSGREAIDGFTKNLFAVFDYRLLQYLFAFIWLMVMFWEPFIVMFMMKAEKASLSQRNHRHLFGTCRSFMADPLYQPGHPIGPCFPLSFHNPGNCGHRLAILRL
jgi:hypothetical protein